MTWSRTWLSVNGSIIFCSVAILRIQWSGFRPIAAPLGCLSEWLSRHVERHVGQLARLDLDPPLVQLAKIDERHAVVTGRQASQHEVLVQHVVAVDRVLLAGLVDLNRIVLCDITSRVREILDVQYRGDK